LFSNQPTPNFNSLKHNRISPRSNETSPEMARQPLLHLRERSIVGKGGVALIKDIGRTSQLTRNSYRKI